MSATAVADELDAEARRLLLGIARRCIELGLRMGSRGELVMADYPLALRRLGASFVTLRRDGALRGCIGTLEAKWPLAEDVHRNAYAAAFHDPRFPPLTPMESETVRLSLSILSTPQPLEVESEDALLAVLRPGVDGLIVEHGRQRATFLPSVWDVLPDTRDFVAELKLKAGLPADFWAESLRFQRYTTTSVEEE